ncbi:hypothetical protein EDC94DRAFT_625220 [Helicostylum pulchrum]|nr:hypothetical protein EDC94DRAFT_625220 [Helicostylum pulchrum]
MSHSPVINYGQDEIPHLRSQNDQLWKIIEKQRVMIQNLQKDNVRLSAERDGLQDQISTLEKEVTRKQRVASLLISPQALREIAEADDASTPTPNSDSPVEAFSFVVPTSSPMPPPRSPYRPLKEKCDDYIKEPFEPESFLRNMDDMNGRSSPGSPAPGPHHHHSSARRKDSAPLPSPSTRTQSPFIVPSPSKSSSSLEVRRNNIARQRDSMMPPARAGLDYDASRAASPPVPYRSSTSRNTKRESMIFSSSRTDLSMDESTFDEEIIQPDLSQKQQFVTSHLSLLSVKVVGSNIKPNEKGKEVVSFILSVGTSEEDESKEERWRVEKFYSDFLSLDAKLKTQRSRTTSSRMGKLPDKALFSNNAPTKVDQRKIALEQYLKHAIGSPLDDTFDICEFLSTNIVDIKVYQPVGQMREGYLTKRGKNFGGWKTRYFVLNESILEYYESKEGTQLGSIRLTNAQIGRQMPGSSQASEEYNSVYRHAFLIVEQKRVGSTHYVRHILCANSDDDRDDWVQALLENIHIEEDPIALTKSTSSSSSSSKKKKEEKPRKLSKGEIRAISATPISHLKLDSVANADMEKLTSVPSMDDHSIGMALSSKPYTRPTPSVSSESTDSVPVSDSLPSNSMTWSSPYDQVVRTSLDHTNRNLQAPRPAIVRRSSMGNLISASTEQQLINEDFLNPHQYNRALSPTLPSEETTVETEPEKKARNKAHRMTFWGKKMLFSNTEQQNVQQSGPPKLSQSTSATTSSGDISRSTTTSTSSSSGGGGLRGFLSRSSHEQSDRSRNKYGDDMPLPKPAKQVFGVSLEEAVRISRVSEGYELPAVVYRCIEYLDAMDAVLEEGLYRLSGSNSTMKALREKFNQEGDVNLMAAKDDYDVHVVAGLLKMWLRELPTSVLTREHRMDFLHVIDLLDRKDRVNELGRLVSVLPLPNYTLLRALTAHLIRVVQHSDINKMTMRNVSIVFSPTLGIPATIFNLFMSEFEYIFWTTEDGDAAPRMIPDEPEEVTIVVVEEEEAAAAAPVVENSSEEEMVQEQQAPLLSRRTTLRLREEHGRSNRNSVNYMDGAPNAIVDLEKNMDGPPVLDEDDDEDVDDLTLSTDSNYQPHLYAQQT